MLDEEIKTVENKLPKTDIHLRIQFIHKPINRTWLNKKYPFIIQNQPFEYGLKIKNIGSEPFSGATIKDFKIQNREMYQRARQVKVKPLNPDEEVEMYFDKYTLWHDGSISTSCILLPEKDTENIISYQHLRDHNVDEPYKESNKWWQDYYCQSQQQLLQTRTNNSILLLTVITVLEAVFGLNEILKFLAKIFSFIFENMYLLFAWLAS